MEEVRNAYKILILNVKGRDHPEGVGVVWRIILKWILRKDIFHVGVDSMHLVQDRDKWQALVNTVMNHRVP
jgi:hypothetical protein